MKLDPDCVRDVLLEFESLPMGNYDVRNFPATVEKHGHETVLYTLVKLSEAHYINAIIDRTLDGYPHISGLYDISYDGHQFLDTIRENAIWSKTKHIIEKIGSGSFSLIMQIASSILTNAANTYLKGQP